MKDQILGTLEVIILILIGISIICGGLIAIVSVSPVLFVIGLLWLIHEVLDEH